MGILFDTMESIYVDVFGELVRVRRNGGRREIVDQVISVTPS